MTCICSDPWAPTAASAVTTLATSAVATLATSAVATSPRYHPVPHHPRGRRHPPPPALSAQRTRAWREAGKPRGGLLYRRRLRREHARAGDGARRHRCAWRGARTQALARRDACWRGSGGGGWRRCFRGGAGLAGGAGRGGASSGRGEHRCRDRRGVRPAGASRSRVPALAPSHPRVTPSRPRALVPSRTHAPTHPRTHALTPSRAAPSCLAFPRVPPLLAPPLAPAPVRAPRFRLAACS